MDNDDLEFKQFITDLVYDIKTSKATNQKAENISFPTVRTTSNDDFIKYILSMAYHFRQYLVVYKSEPIAYRYHFKCSYDGCGMELIFSENKEGLIINKDKSNFEHDYNVHSKTKPKCRISEETYKEFLEWCKTFGSTRLFVETHSDLENYPMKLMFQRKTEINIKFNNINYIINELMENSLFISKVIKMGDVLIGCIVINKHIIKFM